MASVRAYTPEQDFRVCNFYAENIKVYPSATLIKSLAKELGKTEKSITAKLVSRGLYKREEYKTKTGGIPIKKEILADQLGEFLGLGSEDKKGLARVNKTVLLRLLKEFT